MMFTDALKLHLDSIQNKDLEKFKSTISEDSITLIMLNGKIIDDRREFIEFHREWFLDEDWNLTYDIIKMDETDKMAYALLAVNYEDMDSEGKPIHMKYYLNLIFKLKQDKWLLVFDQNTNLK